jgi:hypothetical protein
VFAAWGAAIARAKHTKLALSRAAARRARVALAGAFLAWAGAARARRVDEKLRAQEELEVSHRVWDPRNPAQANHGAWTRRLKTSYTSVLNMHADEAVRAAADCQR